MKHLDNLFKEIEIAKAYKLYNLALITAVTIPDIICQSVKDEITTPKDYIEWFDSYVSPNYLKHYKEESILAGGDFYSLRCSVLHQGKSTIQNQKKRKNLNDFIFISSEDYNKMHFKEFESNNKLRIHIEKIIDSIKSGYIQWKSELSENLLIKHNSYDFLIINSISLEVIDSFEKVINSKQ